MKYIFTILLIIPICLWGQKKDADSAWLKGMSTADATNLLITKWINADDAKRGGMTITQKQDTIHVIMLVCDTSNRPHSSMKYVTNGLTYINDGQGIWWQFGYEIRERWGSVLWLDEEGNIIDPPIVYLDKDKKVLPKNIVVWTTQDLKR